MKKLIIITAITMWATIALHAQTEFEAEESFRFMTSDAFLEFKPILFEAEDVCNPSAYSYTTNMSAFRFNKAVKAPSFEPPELGENLVFKANRTPAVCHPMRFGSIEFKINNSTKLQIRGSDGTVVVNHTNTDDWNSALLIKVNNGLTKALVVENTNTQEDVLTIWGNGIVNAKKIYAEEFEVTPNAMGISWYDHVFEKDYKLMSLYELERFIQTNKHLPEIPSEKEVKENGINLGEIQGKLLMKVEELTLYIIEQQKLIDDLQKRLTELETKKGGKE